MSGSITRFISILLYSMMGISALLAILFYVGAITEEPFLVWAYILFGIAALTTISFAFAGIFATKKAAKSSLIYLGVVVAIILLGYILASGEILTFSGHEEFFYENNSMDPHVFSRIVGTAIYTMYIFGIVAVVSMLYSEVSKLFK
jgi:multisubunit Na+/H+ antiporter MnhF subunit